MLPWNCTVDFQLTGSGSGAQVIDGDKQREKQTQKQSMAKANGSESGLEGVSR